jgi:hypothetical protein
MRAQGGERVPILRVEVWYADGSRRAAADFSSWCELPDDVVLVQVLYAYVYKDKYLQDVLAGHDWFWWHGDRIDNTRAGDVPRGCYSSALKRGVQVPDDTYLRIYNEASEGVIVGEG